MNHLRNTLVQCICKVGVVIILAPPIHPTCIVLSAVELYPDLLCRGIFFSSNSTGVEEDNWGVDFMAMAANIESKTSTFKLLDGHTIPVFGLGVWQAKANGETEQAVLWALKHGYRLIDTAATYK